MIKDSTTRGDARRSLEAENAANLLLGMAADYRRVLIVRRSQHSLENVAANTLIASDCSDSRSRRDFDVGTYLSKLFSLDD